MPSPLMDRIMSQLEVSGPLRNAPLCEALHMTGNADRRDVDRALQQLRNAGRAHYLSPVAGWAATALETCPTCGGRGMVTARAKPARKPAP